MVHFPPTSSLRAAEASARLGSFTLAAAQLNVTQSAVSQAVRTLEGQLGAVLFRRLPGRVETTPEGATYIAAIAPALRAIQAAGDAISTSSPERLSVGCVRSLLHNWLLPRLPSFTVAHPRAHVNVVGLGREVAQSRGSDIAIVLSLRDQPPAHARLLSHEDLVAVAAPAIAASFGTLETAAQPLPAPLLGSGWEAWASGSGIELDAPAVGVQYRDGSAVLAAARAGQGIALVSTLMCHGDLKTGALVSVSDVKVDRGRAYWLIQNKASNVAEAFIDWLQSLVTNP